MQYLYKSVPIFFVLFITFFCQAGFAIQAPPLTDASKTIVVSKDKPEFTLSLASNPTTGYSWAIKLYNAHFLKVVRQHFHPATSQLVGAGGIDVWTFKVNPAAFAAPHILKIKMLYVRSWNVKDDAKEAEFTVMTQ